LLQLSRTPSALLCFEDNCLQARKHVHCAQSLPGLQRLPEAVVAARCNAVPDPTVAFMQLMTRLCETIMASLHEFLGATISVMSQAALATLFLEMNFIEGIIPDCLKTETFDNRIEDCYHLVLTQLLRLVQNKMPSPKTEFGKARCG
jgi:hypothetical protein